MIPIRSIHKLDRDAQTVVSSPYTSLKNRSHIQPFPNDAWVAVFSLEREGGTSCHNVELVDLCQRVDDLFSNAVGKEFVLGIGADIDKRKDSDRITRGAYSRSGLSVGHSPVD